MGRRWCSRATRLPAGSLQFRTAARSARDAASAVARIPGTATAVMGRAGPFRFPIMPSDVAPKVPDRAAPKNYRDEFVPLVGFAPFRTPADKFTFRPACGKSGTFLLSYPTARPEEPSWNHAGPPHIAFVITTRLLVERVHPFIARRRRGAAPPAVVPAISSTPLRGVPA